MGHIMHKHTWILMTALLGLTSMAIEAATPKYDTLVVFGDSYCDVGNLFLATSGAEAAPPYSTCDSPTALSGWTTWPAS